MCQDEKMRLFGMIFFNKPDDPDEPPFEEWTWEFDEKPAAPQETAA